MDHYFRFIAPLAGRKGFDRLFGVLDEIGKRLAEHARVEQAPISASSPQSR